MGREERPLEPEQASRVRSTRRASGEGTGLNAAEPERPGIPGLPQGQVHLQAPGGGEAGVGREPGGREGKTLPRAASTLPPSPAHLLTLPSPASFPERPRALLPQALCSSPFQPLSRRHPLMPAPKFPPLQSPLAPPARNRVPLTLRARGLHTPFFLLCLGHIH